MKQSGNDTRVAVIVEPAHPARITSMLMAAYGMTDRERDVTSLVLQGSSTAQIADDLHVSPHTVQQHLKSVFDKTGVRSRRDLVGRVFFTHYEPRLRDNEHRGHRQAGPRWPGGPPLGYLVVGEYCGMAMLERDGAVWLLDLGATENRFNGESVALINGLLDEVENAEGPRALVTRAIGKYWSNGLDLDWMMADPERAGPLLAGVHVLLARVLVMPLPTVAAITGHCYAAGAMLSVAHDSKVMRVDRGYWCLPEVDLGLPFTPLMNALLVAKLPKRTAHEAMTTARRYTAPEAEAAGILDATAAEDAVVSMAVERAAALAGKASPALGEIKSRLYADALAALTAPAA